MTNTKDFDWKRLVVIPAARQHGRLTQQMIEFYAACKKGEKVVFRMPEGDICSPEYAKVVINEAIQSDHQQLLKAVEEMKIFKYPNIKKMDYRQAYIAGQMNVMLTITDLLKAKDYIKEFDNQIPREGL